MVKQAKSLCEAVEWLRPSQQTVAGVQELAESYPSHRRTLMPVEGVTTSHRIRRIASHPAMLRLNRVPQLVMASTLFPGATHTRYEHSLGTATSAKYRTKRSLSHSLVTNAFSVRRSLKKTSSAELKPYSRSLSAIKLSKRGVTYQAVRRYLLALLDDSEFLAYFSPSDIECCLVCALLSGITRFPFSMIVQELRSGSSGLFARSSRTRRFSMNC